MDFKTQVIGAQGLSGVGAEALLVLVSGQQVPEGLDPALADALSAAVKDGDFAFKSGQTLYMHRVAGVKAARLVFAYLADDTAKTLRKSIGLSVTYVKGSGARQLAVAAVGGPGWTAAQAEAVVAALSDATYLYRETKPSAPITR